MFTVECDRHQLSTNRNWVLLKINNFQLNSIGDTDSATHKLSYDDSFKMNK